MVNDSADVTSSGRSFHVCGPATGIARLPTVMICEETLMTGCIVLLCHALYTAVCEKH